MEIKPQFDKYKESPTICDLLLKGEAIPVGFSNSDVFRVTFNGDHSFLRIKPFDGFEPYTHEMAVLKWLSGKAPVPEVLQCGIDNGYEYSLLSALHGSDCCSLADDRTVDFEFLASILGVGLRDFHSIPIDDCPFDQRLAGKLAFAEGNIKSGRITEQDIDPKLRPLSPRNIYDYLISEIPQESELVFSHGDFCLPNVLISEKSISGYIDLYWAGISDKYNDLAIASRSIAHNLGDEYQEVFFAAYGLEKPNKELIKYYRFLDELF